MFEYTGCFYLFLAFLDIPRHFEPLKHKKHAFLMIASCGKLFKTTILQNHERNHKKFQFLTKLLLIFSTKLLVIFFWLEWFLMDHILTCLVSLNFYREKWAF